MRTLAVINQKGGVGKTTSAVNLSAALAEMGQRVCLIDLDAQAHASLHLGITPGEHEGSIYDVLTRGKSLSDVRRQVGENLWVVPSHIDLAAAEMELASEVGRELILRDKLAEDREHFDLLVIDCAPSLGLLTLNALAAVQEVLLPLQPHFLALHGLSKLLGTIDVVRRRINSRLKLCGVVMCMFDSATRLAVEVTRDVEDFFESQHDPSSAWFGAKPFATRIRRNIRLAEAPSFGQSIFQYAGTSNGAEDYRALAIEMLQRQAALAVPKLAEAA